MIEELFTIAWSLRTPHGDRPYLQIAVSCDFEVGPLHPYAAQDIEDALRSIDAADIERILKRRREQQS